MSELPSFSQVLGWPELAPETPCLRCGIKDGVALEPKRTAYPWNGEGEDPNGPIALCRECAADHHADMDDLWACARGG